MTSRRAERICGYEVRSISQNCRSFTFGLYEGSAEILRATGSTPGECLENLVRSNFDRVGQIVCKEQRGRCLICNRFSSVGLQRHHIVPRSKGRDDRRQNICGLCPDCHRKVTDGMVLEPHPRMVSLMNDLEEGWESA